MSTKCTELSVCYFSVVLFFFFFSLNQYSRFLILCDNSKSVTLKHLVCVLLQNSVIVLEVGNFAQHETKTQVWVWTWMNHRSAVFNLKKRCALNVSIKSFIKVLFSSLCHIYSANSLIATCPVSYSHKYNQSLSHSHSQTNTHTHSPAV